MPNRYAAFISYAHRYQEWVASLQQNLEACLRHAGADPHELFLDQTDLASGRSWVGQLQDGLAQADHFILVATPEALASPRAKDEWEAFLAYRRDWAEGSFHIALLVEVPLPPFVGKQQWVSFVEHDEEGYREALRQLAGGLLGGSARDLPALPDGLTIPPPPAGELPAGLRPRLVGWLAPYVGQKLLRPAIAKSLGLPFVALEGFATPEGGASAAIVAATGDDDRLQAARRIVRALLDAFDEQGEETLAELNQLAADLGRLDTASGGGLLGAWLAKVRRDHSNLVPFFEHAELELLDRVYVQLQLRPEQRLLRGTADAKEADTRLAGHPLTLRDLLPLDPDEHSWVTRRWVVRGDPGAGKTTLLRHLAATLAAEKPAAWVPIFESLPRLMRKPEWLLDRLEREMRKGGEAVQGLATALDQEGKEGRLLLLLDGLDEVPREDREDAEALLRQLSARWPDTPLVVTSRPIGYRRPGSEFVELDLLPFDEEQRAEFLARWFGRKSGKPNTKWAAKVLRTLSQEGLWELSGNPLYLTLMALLFEEDKEPNRNRSQLFFDLLLEGKHRPAGKPIEAKKPVYELLRRLAFDMTKDNQDGESREDLEARLLHEDYDPLTDPLRRVPAWERSLRAFLDDLAKQTGILGPHDGPNADWRYWHRTFREALAAEKLAADLKAGGAESVLQQAKEIALEESRWAEPYALLVGQADDPDTLVTTMVGENPSLALRAVFFSGRRLSDATLQRVFNLLGHWQRAFVYRAIPQLLDDPERALALVDQLRQGTTDGDDLYFLDETLTAIGQRWESAAVRVEDYRERSFDHIDPPPEELFRRVEVPLDGKVELWREIPKGEGWIGSPKGEGHEDEHPRHQVTITRPYRMAAVTVTNRQYRAFDRTHTWEAQEGVSEEELAHHPVVNVSWYEAVSFCRWLAKRHPGARLPREEEWEYACRAGHDTRYWKGDREEDLAEVGWYDKNSEGRTHRVGEKPANPWGLYDVHGNVREWTLTKREVEAYKRREEPVSIDPATVASSYLSGGLERVIRGGSYYLPANWARSAFRFGNDKGQKVGFQGFRVLLPAP